MSEFQCSQVDSCEIMSKSGKYLIAQIFNVCITFHVYSYKFVLQYHRAGGYSESSIVYSAALFSFSNNFVELN